MKIEKIWAREILDSRGDPTVECTVTLEDGSRAKSGVPSGASTGIHEALELRDADPKRYSGKGVLKAVENVNTEIAKAVIGRDAYDQRGLDQLMISMDGTENKARLGANAILSVSLAVARAAALSKKMELFRYIAACYNLPEPKALPTPSFNIFNGGKHADTNLDFQEFMIMPLRNISFKEKVRLGAEVFHELGQVLKEAGLDTDVGNEGGYAPDISSSVQAMELIMAAMVRAGYEPGKDVGFGIDVGSSGLYDEHKKQYIFKLDKSSYTSGTLVGLYNEWFRRFPIISIEDGLAEDDWEGWRDLTKELGQHMLLIGDDIFVTNESRLRRGLKEQVANAVLIKPNQVGTLSETVDCVALAHRHGYETMVSHRSGETSDDFIADLAVALGSSYIKSGSLSRGERLAKYNRLMEIEDILSA